MIQKWEYKVTDTSGLMRKRQTEQEINKLGLEGWEAVGVHVQPGAIWVLFKRPLP